VEVRKVQPRAGASVYVSPGVFAVGEEPVAGATGSTGAGRRRGGGAAGAAGAGGGLRGRGCRGATGRHAAEEETIHGTALRRLGRSWNLELAMEGWQKTSKFQVQMQE